ncbi:MAG: hypothetical protein JO360_13450 [Acidobacteria bacterium]|nr:hypothetical protein [Acidobacteriota bacterium]
MASQKDSTPNEIPLPAGPMRERLAQAQAAGASNADICEQIDVAANELIRQACAKKQFDLTFGNCPKEGCQTVEKPKIVPCFHLRWGDGPQDHLETDDTEVLCLTVCNPYSNVVLNNFTVQLVIAPAGGGPIPNQADGTPSVMIKPSFMICFDDVPPCNPQQHNQQGCVTREVVLINRGAVPGPYRIFIFYCFEACFTEVGAGPAFQLDLVSS